MALLSISNVIVLENFEREFTRLNVKYFGIFLIWHRILDFFKEKYC